MQQAIERIQRYLYDMDHTGFLANEEKQDAVIRNLEIIGEAAANIQRHFPEFALIVNQVSQARCAEFVEN